MSENEWNALNTYDLQHVAAGKASCIVETEKLETADGPMQAKDILEACKKGERIDFLSQNKDGKEWRNPVVGAIATTAESVRIIFVDGRSVSLTGNHVLPVTEAKQTGSIFQESVPIFSQAVITADKVTPGMELADGTVSQVIALGRQKAVRLWTYHPAWITTSSGLRIGTRWHEVIRAWAWVSENEEADEFQWEPPDPEVIFGWYNVYPANASSTKKKFRIVKDEEGIPENWYLWETVIEKAFLQRLDLFEGRWAYSHERGGNEVDYRRTRKAFDESVVPVENLEPQQLEEHLVCGENTVGKGAKNDFRPKAA